MMESPVKSKLIAVISQIASPVDLRPASFVESAVISDFTTLFPPAIRSPEPRLLFSSMVEFLHKVKKAVYHVYCSTKST